MSSYVIDIDPANVDADFYVAVGALVAATPIALVNTASPDGLAHQLAVAPSATINGIVITIVGTDADGKTITEAVTGATDTTVETVKYFKTVSSVTPGATDAATINVGFVDEVISPWYALNWRENVPAAFFQLDVTGTINVDVQFTIADPARFSGDATVPTVVDADIDGETADVAAYIGEVGYHAFRVVVNSYTNTAELQLYTSQPEGRG